MGVLDFLNRHFGEQTDLPIEVADDLSLFVEEKRAPKQGLSQRSYTGFLDDSMDDSSD
jgi:hypothetical protein